MTPIDAGGGGEALACTVDDSKSSAISSSRARLQDTPCTRSGISRAVSRFARYFARSYSRSMQQRLRCVSVLARSLLLVHLLLLA